MGGEVVTWDWIYDLMF